MYKIQPLFRLITCAAVAAVFLAASLRAEDAKPIRVALFDDAGSMGKGVPRVSEQLGKVDDMKVTIVKGKEIAAGVLTNYDVVVFTGGSGSRQASSLGDKGREEVRKFVKNGGGYVGICAGAYLACSGFSWGVGVLDAKTVSSKWMRGRGDVEIEVTENGKAITAISTEKQPIHYANGPIIMPNGRDDIPDYEPIAFFRTELANNGSPKGVMVNSPAMARGEFGKGRVLISSPHPEQTAGMEGFAEHAVRWVAGKPNK